MTKPTFLKFDLRLYDSGEPVANSVAILYEYLRVFQFKTGSEIHLLQYRYAHLLREGEIVFCVDK